MALQVSHKVEATRIAGEEENLDSPQSDSNEIQQWYKTYRQNEPRMLPFDSPAILAVEADDLDHEEVEAAVRREMRTRIVQQGFCKDCQHLLDNWPFGAANRFKVARVRCFDTIELEAGTRNGCRFCGFLYSCHQDMGQLDTVRKLEARLKIAGDRTQSFLGRLESSFERLESYYDESSLYILVNLPGDIPIESSRPGMFSFQSEVIDPTGSARWNSDPDAIEIARKWLHDCITLHAECTRSETTRQPWPSRLVEVRRDTLRLVSTDLWPTMPQYATLSYCWGSEPFTMLTPANMSMFFDEIPSAQLPTVFRDAVSLVRHLGLQYIWIDALCIIQDPVDKTDWTREAGRMRFVYGGSTLNIAATSATSVHGSCLDKPISHRTGFAARVTMPDEHGDAQYSTVRNFYDYCAHRISVNGSHLASRGWALQERLLPCRTLFVGNRGFFWECCAVKASEFFPTGGPPKWNDPYLKGPQNGPWNWGSVAKHYSATSLTFSSDKLPALSGIAQRQSEFTGDAYIAGMWRRFLAAQLPWLITPQRALTKKPEWRAPSWSWLSVDGEINWEKGEEPGTQFVRVLEVVVQPLGPDPWGALKDAYLVLACTVMIPGRLQSQLQRVLFTQDMVLSESDGDGLSVSIDCLQEPGRQIDQVFLLPLQTLKRDWNSSGPGCLKCSNGESNVDIGITGLVLQQHRGNKGHFYRVGAFRVPHDILRLATGEQLKCEFYALRSAMESVGTATAATECIRVEESGENYVPGAQYVIKIV